MIRVGNAPCSWGVLEFDLEGGAAGATQVLGELAAAGYAGTELGDWGFMPTEPEALRALLARHGLAMVGAFVPVALADEAAHEAGVAAAVRTARLLAAVGAPYLVLADDNGEVPERVACAGRIRADQGLSAAQWALFARGAERVALAVREATGLRTVFHHHGGGWVETPTEVDALLTRTSPDLLGLCLDTGHWALGGGDPLEALDRWGPRVWHLHAKDCHPGLHAQAAREGWDYFEAVRRGVFCELGQGGVDFAAFARAIADRDGWLIVEQDVLPGMGTPFESARRNREFLRGLGL
ncbi:MAG: TIM barrel protein [Pseudomonadota bacterium]